MTELKGKFSTDVLWNVASLVVLGLSGIIVNIVIAKFSGAEALGVFNQVFAIYIFLSQICVGGVHFSVLKEISYNQEDPLLLKKIVSSAVVLSAFISIVICLPALLLHAPIGRLLDSPGVGKGMLAAIPGLFFFSINKNLLNVLNGMQWMRAYAVFQALRFLGILISVLILIGLGSDPWLLPLSLSASEVVLSICLGTFVHTKVVSLSLSEVSRNWLRSHFSFGMKGFLSGVFTEINTRVDILMLGIFLSDSRVGVYSFAAMLAEGFSQLPFVIRKNVDPIIGKSLAAGDNSAVESFSWKLKKAFVPIMAIIGILAALLYPIILPYVVDGQEFMDSTMVFWIFCAAIVANSAYRPFLGLILQGGRPGLFTMLVGSLVLLNIVLNYALIPILEISGAALATGIVYLAEAVLLGIIARRVFGIKL